MQGVVTGSNGKLAQAFAFFLLLMLRSSLQKRILMNVKCKTIRCELYPSFSQGASAAGVALYLKDMSPNTKVIGAQSNVADSMLQSFKPNERAILKILSFQDFVKQLLYHQYHKFTWMCMQKLDQSVTVDEGKTSTTILQHHNMGIVVEPAGALSVSKLDNAHEIKYKNVVCILSGDTVAFSRFNEFKKHSQLYEGLKYFF